MQFRHGFRVEMHTLDTNAQSSGIVDLMAPNCSLDIQIKLQNVVILIRSEFQCCDTCARIMTNRFLSVYARK